MKLQLILAGPSASCERTRQLWQELCKRNTVDLEILDIEQDKAQALIQKLDLKTFPALITDGKINAVGHPTEEKARELLAQLIKC